MKKFILGILLFATAALGADVKISQLPLGSAATTGANDSFPYVANVANITKRLTIWDLVNVPAMVSTYAPKASPVFTGTVTAPTFIGALTGNASTATALASNPTDCSAGQYANAIAANGNLTCAAVTTSQLTWTGTSGGIPYFNSTSTIASSALLSANQLIVGGGAATAPLTLAAGSQYQVLRMGAVSPAYGSINLDQSAAITGTLPIANGGTNSTATATAGGIAYGTGTAYAVSSAGTTGYMVVSGGTGSPTYRQIKTPTVQTFTSGTAQTYTTPAGVLYIKVKMVGGGGGGAGSGPGSSSGTAAGNGGTSYFRVGASPDILVAAGGGGAPTQVSGGVCSIGTASVTSPGLKIAAISGQQGGGGQVVTTGGSLAGSPGGNSPFYVGAGSFPNPTTGGSQDATANTGSGGGGALANVNTVWSGGGGCGGGGVEAFIPSPSATYEYSVGTAGSAGAAGSSGFVGGAGSAGYIEVTEYYQ